MKKIQIEKPEKPDEVQEVKNESVSAMASESRLPTQCPYRQALLLQQTLISDKMRIAFLLGAGCPVSISIEDGESTRPLIPDINDLTAYVKSSLEKSTEFRSSFEIILKRLSGMGECPQNIETILSHIRALCDVAGNGLIDGLSQKDLSNLDSEICKVITTAVEVELPTSNTPYHRLATWVRGIQRSHPIEIFTPNYDLLMEQAFEELRVPFFDGFVGSRHSFFDLNSIEQDSLPSRWARLWKVHGSINWWRTSIGTVERRSQQTSGDRQMIYPSHLKYDESRRMPYFAMLDRLKGFLSDGQAVLITCGYSFSDQHLNDVILQGLIGNPTAVCFGLIYGDLTQAGEAVKRAHKQPNLSLLAVNGAIIGTMERCWHAAEKTEHPLHGIAAKAGRLENRTESPESSCKFLLGDFSAFGEFLARQLVLGDDVKGENINA